MPRRSALAAVLLLGEPVLGGSALRPLPFFTDTGQFASLTEDLEQVDDRPYEITQDGTFVISEEFPDVTFHYEVGGDTLTITPVSPSR
jgi:hypothetical protein